MANTIGYEELQNFTAGISRKRRDHALEFLKLIRKAKGGRSDTVALYGWFAELSQEEDFDGGELLVILSEATEIVNRWALEAVRHFDSHHE